MEFATGLDEIAVRTLRRNMRLIYPLHVAFVDVNRQSTVRLKGLTLAFLNGEHLVDETKGGVQVYVRDENIEASWPHYFYVLVSKSGSEQRNLSRLQWFTAHALHMYRNTRNQTMARKRSSKIKPMSSNENAPQHPVLKCDYELVLYDVDVTLTSLYDHASVLDDWNDIERSFSDSRTDDVSDETNKPRQMSLTRPCNLYRIKVSSMSEYRYLFEHFRDNAHYWQKYFSVPVNLLNDNFRFSIDVYVQNLRFQINRSQLAAAGLLDSRATNAAGTGGVGGASSYGSSGRSTEMYRKILHKWNSAGVNQKYGLLRTFPLDLKKWFAPGKWCLFDAKCVSSLPQDEFVLCVRNLLGLGEKIAANSLLHHLYEKPLDFLVRVVWDIETVAIGKGTIPRGVTVDQKISSIACSLERPVLDTGRVVLLWVLAPDSMSTAEIEQSRVIGKDYAKDDEERLKVKFVRVNAYRDERALLMDFLVDMFTNWSLLTEFFGVQPQHVDKYQNVVSWLVGFNSIEYDYAFLLDRLIFFDLKDMAPALFMLRRFSNLALPLSHAYVFNASQICLDMLQFLRARNRQLKSYKLSSVLKVYNCDIDKIEFSAVEIRRLYFTQEKWNLPPIDDHLLFLRDILRYNVFDCLSLFSLLDRTSLSQHTTVMMDYFYAVLEQVLYKGNSSLLPTTVQMHTMLRRRQIAVTRQPQHNNFLCGSNRVQNSVFRVNQRAIEDACGIRIELERFPLNTDILSSENPYVAALVYHRLMTMMCNRNDVSRSTLESVSSQEFCQGNVAFCSHNELEQLRVGEKTYIGGMNFAVPGHSKYPILMDYNSFYPSIIRSYKLDVNGTAIVDIKFLMLTIPIPLLDCLLATKVLRFFDYTSLDDVDYTVDMVKHLERVGEPWHEAVEYTNWTDMFVTSKHLGRRFLVLLYTPNSSTIDEIVTEALQRRAVWKRKKKENPNDVVVQFMELMEKLLANSLYGYLNFSLSAIFSRSTAASVTLLCRNAFCRTRRIIESRELLATTLIDPDLYRFRVMYIDTDGCIFVLTRIDESSSQGSIIDPQNPYKPWFRLYADLEPENTVAVYDRLTATINATLDLKHVTLAAEHYDTASVCVFSTKKYVLLKGPHGSVKKTGFESNAARPVRDMYEIVLKNALRVFLSQVEYPRFVVFVRSHRLFLCAMYDYLFSCWQSCLKARIDGDVSSPYTLQDFGLNRPLNEKDTDGEMSRFIDRILYQFQYSSGERVWILKLFDVENAVEDGVLYPARGKFVMLEELEDAQLPFVLPNLKFFIGCYARYLYQCVEGQQTLRESSTVTRESIETGFFLESFQAISSYCWGVWLYHKFVERYPKVKLRGIYWPETGVFQEKTAFRLDKRDTPNFRRLPNFLSVDFLNKLRCEPSDNPFFVNLFEPNFDALSLEDRKTFIYSEKKYIEICAEK